MFAISVIQRKRSWNQSDPFLWRLNRNSGADQFQLSLTAIKTTTNVQDFHAETNFLLKHIKYGRGVKTHNYNKWKVMNFIKSSLTPMSKTQRASDTAWTYTWLSSQELGMWNLCMGAALVMTAHVFHWSNPQSPDVVLDWDRFSQHSWCSMHLLPGLTWLQPPAHPAPWPSPGGACSPWGSSQRSLPCHCHGKLLL